MAGCTSHHIGISPPSLGDCHEKHDRSIVDYCWHVSIELLPWLPSSREHHDGSQSQASEGQARRSSAHGDRDPRTRQVR